MSGTAQAPALGEKTCQFAVGLLKIDCCGPQVLINGEILRFTEREREIFELLLANAGQTVSKTDFLRHFYGTNESKWPESKIIDVFICKIRRRLKSTGVDDLIKTKWGLGYVLASTTPAATIPHTKVTAGRVRVRKSSPLPRSRVNKNQAILSRFLDLPDPYGPKKMRWTPRKKEQVVLVLREHPGTFDAICQIYGLENRHVQQWINAYRAGERNTLKESGRRQKKK